MDIDEIYEYYRPYLKKIDSIIYNCCKDRFPLISEIVSYVLQSGGKRIRPLLTIISADLCNSLNSETLKLAAAIELIHTATLLHDDVIDNSTSRRNKPTVNYEWGNKTSILMGDFLFSQAFELMVATKSLSSLELLSETSSIISEGEIIQLKAIGELDIDFDTYYKIINAKTAVLFAAATKVGALISRDNQHLANNLYLVGQKFGIAFQIIDDLLDYYRAPNSGKNSGDDFYEGKVTLPIIKLYQLAEENDKELLTRIWQEEDFTADNLAIIKKMLDKYKIDILIKQLSSEYLNSCFEQLTHFEKSYANKSMIYLLDFCINRQF